MTQPANQFQYKPLHKPNQLIYGTGQTAIVTGWTIKQAIAKHLQPHEYAVIGQLYSPTRGIGLLIRNLLFNPHVRFLIALNATKEDRNAGGCECLLDFFRNGFELGYSDTGRSCWLIRSNIKGFIDIEIDAHVLEKLRQSIEWQQVNSIAEASRLAKSYTLQDNVKPWSHSLEFPISNIVPVVLPGRLYGHRIEGKTIAETWIKIIHKIKTSGTIRPTQHDGKWQELIDVMAIVTDEPANFYFPEPNYLPCNRAFIDDYISQILDDAPTQEGIKYTYGQRLRSWFGKDQIQQVIQKLTVDINSARAVMSLWDVQDHESNNPPCLNHIWVRVVDNELSMTATFRSNDMFSAWVANAMGLRALQQYIRDAIAQRDPFEIAPSKGGMLSSPSKQSMQPFSELKMGPLIIISQSAHIYDDCWENVDKIIQSHYHELCQRRDYNDPVGNFTINVQDHKIVVEHTTPGSGEVINCYSGKTASQLTSQIAENCPDLQLEHALYLGTELQKAEIALSNQHFIYEQDKPLR